MKKRIDVSELKAIQLEMLKAVDVFCKNNGLRYSLAFGSLLGAVRHKGYIPWDDDLDIMLLREDYNKFISGFKSSTYTIVEPSRNRDYALPFAKVYDNRTVINEYSNTKSVYGVYIDVFPVDNVPDDLHELNRFMRHKAWLNKLHILKVVRCHKNRLFIKNLILVIGQVLLAFKSVHNIAIKMNELSAKYSTLDNCKFRGIIVPDDNRMDEFVPSEYFDSYITLPFENLEVMAIKNYDGYLRASYGDYMKYPPKDKQISHHRFEVWWI